MVTTDPVFESNATRLRRQLPFSRDAHSRVAIANE
jgi:hypothetical protein